LISSFNSLVAMATWSHVRLAWQWITDGNAVDNAREVMDRLNLFHTLYLYMCALGLILACVLLIGISYNICVSVLNLVRRSERVENDDIDTPLKSE
jgi:hypothetical protein